MDATISSTEIAPRPLSLRTETVKSAAAAASEARLEVPAHARPFHQVSRNAHPVGDIQPVDEPR